MAFREAVSSASPTPTVSGAVDPKTVLLVDGDEDSRIVYATLLEHRGYRVLHAEDGEKGLRLVFEHLPDLLVLELRIDMIDGYDLIAHLKQDERTGRIPVLAVTASAMADDREKARRTGCSGYLPKPCKPSRMLAEVQRLIGPPPMGSSHRSPSAALSV